MSAAKGKAPTAATVEALSVKNQNFNQGINVNNSIALTIGTTDVREAGGLYSLNDLHKASGEESKHRPNYFLETDQTKEMAAEILKAGIPAFEVKRGKYGGTYACKELVIAYAAWINAKFHLKVIRVFLDAIQTSVRPFNPAIDYDRISPAQAQDLKEIVNAIVKAGIQKHDETWARLHNKFRVNSYLQLPATKHLDARQYLIAKLPNGYAGEVMDDTPQPITPLQLLSHAARSKAAFDAATRAAGEVQRTVFDAVMNGTDDWKHQRLMLAFVTDSAIAAPAYVQPIESGSLVATWARLTEDIRSGECLTSTAELLDMASACMQRMQRRNPPAASISLSH